MRQDSRDKWDYIVSLEEKYLLGGVTASEWTYFLARDADEAYCAGVNLAAILAAQAAIESHLRYEYADCDLKSRQGFFALIEQSPLDSELRNDLHKIRKFRNLWVHVNDPENDQELLERQAEHEQDNEAFAKFAIDRMHCVLCLEQFV
jgi:hypothetical protein